MAAAFALALTGVSLTPEAAAAATVTVTANFSSTVDYPLSKPKFAVYNSCLVPLTQYERDINLINEVHTESLRIDGALGGDPACGYVNDPVSGSLPTPTYDFTEVDEFVGALNDRGVKPYWSYSYQPAPLQIGGDWRSKPSSLTGWSDVLETFSNHFATTGQPVGYQEIWNEPDYGSTFFTGTMADYLDLYEYGVDGILAGDPDAVVGGLSSANLTGWIDPLLNDVDANNQPMDFMSFHQYPSTMNGEPAQIDTYLNTIYGKLAGRAPFHQTELHLNEYNSYPINYPQGGTQDKVGLASSLLRDYYYFLGEPSLDKVSWAQFMDSGSGNFSGMIDINGLRKAVFNAYRIYASMPTDRKAITVSGASNVQGFASSDDHRAGVVLWNRSGSSHTINLTLNNITFPTGTLRVYPINTSNASHGDNAATEGLVATETYANVATAGRTWSGTLANEAVVYLEFDDGTRVSGEPTQQLGDIVRTLSYRPDRGKNSYSDFDPTTWTARLGMGPETWSDEEAGVTVENLPSSVTVQTKVDGTLTKLDANSCACVRIDYQVGGAYTKGVLFHGPYNGGADLYDATRSAPAPFGTTAQPNQVVAVSNLAAFTIDPGAYAPTGWTGRAQISFLLQNSGVGTRASFTLRDGLAGQWSFDEASGATANDSSGRANPGAIISGTRAAAVTRTGLTLNGTSTSVNAGTGASLGFASGSFGVSTWLKTTGTTFQRLLSKGNFGNTNGYLLATNAGSATFAVGAGGVQANSVAVNTPAGLNDGAWHHVAFSVDRASNTLKGWVDGVAVPLTVGSGYCGTASGTTVSTSGCAINGSSSSALTIGSYNGSGEYFAGSLDEVRIYDRALALGDIRADAGQGKAPIAQWRFNDGSGSQASDEAASNNHGYVTSPSWVSGQLGGALAFNGTSSTVNLGNPGLTDFGTGSFTLSTWVKTTGTGFQRVMSNGNYGNTNGYLLATSGGTIVLAIGANGNQAQSVAMNTPTGINNGAWHHVAAVVDRAANTVKIYVDGTAQNLTVGSGFCGAASTTTVNIASCPVNATSQGRLAIGSYNGTTEYFSGSVDETRLYDRPISSGELAGIMAGN